MFCLSQCASIDGIMPSAPDVTASAGRPLPPPVASSPLHSAKLMLRRRVPYLHAPLSAVLLFLLPLLLAVPILAAPCSPATNLGYMAVAVSTITLLCAMRSSLLQWFLDAPFDCELQGCKENPTPHAHSLATIQFHRWFSLAFLLLTLAHGIGYVPGWIREPQKFVDERYG